MPLRPAVGDRRQRRIPRLPCGRRGTDRASGSNVRAETEFSRPCLPSSVKTRQPLKLWVERRKLPFTLHIDRADVFQSAETYVDGAQGPFRKQKMISDLQIQSHKEKGQKRRSTGGNQYLCGRYQLNSERQSAVRVGGWSTCHPKQPPKSLACHAYAEEIRA